MTTAAGRRDRKITFLKPTATEDGLGVEVESFADHEAAWALVLFGSGQERRDAAAQGAVQSATFRVLSTARIREAAERWRIRDAADVEWGIELVTPIGRREIEFTATRIGSN